jgi:hypothetical protein
MLIVHGMNHGLFVHAMNELVGSWHEALCTCPEQLVHAMNQSVHAMNSWSMAGTNKNC